MGTGGSRRTFLARGGTVVGLALAVSACAGGTGSDAAAERLEVAADNKELVRSAFERGVGGPDTFYSLLAEDLRWTVVGPEPSTYTSREQFFAEGSSPIVDRLTGPIEATVRGLWAEGDTVVAWWDGAATARDGRPYRNSYTWIMTVRDRQVSSVVAFLDLAAVTDLVERVAAG